MSVGPTRGPVQRPSDDRDFTEIFQRLDDLERALAAVGWRFNFNNQGGWGYLQFNDAVDLDSLPDPLATGGDWGAAFEEVSGQGFLIGSTTLLRFIAQNFAIGMRGDGAQFEISDRFGSAIATYTGIGLGSRSLVYGGAVAIDMGNNKITNMADGVAADDAATVGQLGGAGAVSSVFGRTGAVVAVTGDYYGAVAAALTGATGASRYVGATTSGAPASGTFAVGDFVIARDGHVFICTSAGTPGTWADAGSASGVSSLAKSGSSALTGAVTLTGGANVTLTQAGNDISIAAAGGSGVVGGTELVYRYTVTGSDKASIDTGADTAQAGSNDWTNGDLLEVFIVGRTDDAAARVNFDVTLNNDAAAHYDNEVLGAANTSVSGTGRVADSSISAALDTHGSGGGASYPGVACLTIPNYAGTTFFKAGVLTAGVADSTAGNEAARLVGFGFRSTAAITRLKIAAQGAAKFKVGTQLLIYKRTAS